MASGASSDAAIASASPATPGLLGGGIEDVPAPVPVAAEGRAVRQDEVVVEVGGMAEADPPSPRFEAGEDQSMAAIVSSRLSEAADRLSRTFGIGSGVSERDDWDEDGDMDGDAGPGAEKEEEEEGAAVDEAEGGEVANRRLVQSV